jgi:hypothetical protein
MLLVVVAALAAERPSFAENPSVREFAEGTVRRARRAVAIGPTVGAAGSYAPSPGDADAPLSAGLELVYFAIPVVPDLREMIVERAKARLTERVADIVARGEPPPDGDELERMAREIALEVKAEILGLHARRDRTLEKPRFAVALEGTYLPRAKAGQIRLTAALGISKVTVGPTLVADFAGGNGLFVGAEVAVHLTPWAGPRANVVDVFIRGDYGITDGTDGADQVGLGVRFLLDVI